MDKIIKVTLEYEDEIKTINGEEAEMWLDNANACVSIAAIHNMNPFDKRPTMWNIKFKPHNLKQ